MFKHRSWDFHPDSLMAHVAACEANAQGKFWPYALALYTQVDEVQRPALEALGARLGLDVERLKKALDSGACIGHIRDDAAQADSLGINATPTLFINGRRVDGDEGAAFFQKAIDGELARLASDAGAP